MRTAVVTAILALPGTALVVIPSLIVWATSDTPLAAQPATPSQVLFWIGLLFAAKGLALMAWTIVDFARIGKGTLAPWAAPKKLVVRGPYRHVRNPMISGAILVLLAQSLLLQSLPVAAWLLVFVAMNGIYIPLKEERGLEKRFGEDYRLYKDSVPRWLPRIRPWRGLDDD